MTVDLAAQPGQFRVASPLTLDRIEQLAGALRVSRIQRLAGCGLDVPADAGLDRSRLGVAGVEVQRPAEHVERLSYRVATFRVAGQPILGGGDEFRGFLQESALFQGVRECYAQPAVIRKVPRSGPVGRRFGERLVGPPQFALQDVGFHLLRDAPYQESLRFDRCTVGRMKAQCPLQAPGTVAYVGPGQYTVRQ